MANPNKACSYKRKMVLLVEEGRNDSHAAELCRTELAQKYAGNSGIVIKVRAFKVGPRPFSRPGVVRQAYNYTIRVYEKRVA